jgi:hypothetical protein
MKLDMFGKKYKLDMFGKRYIVQTIFLLILSDVALLSLLLIPKVIPDYHIGAALFTSVPLFVLAIIQLAKSYRVQRAQYVKDFLMEFRRNQAIVEAYYDLIYSYKDDIYEQVKELAEKREKPNSNEKPVFDLFSKLQGERDKGKRFYYPKFFHFSDEERRLDGVLDFFNTLAYFWAEGLVTMEEIANTLGEYLVVICERKVVREYLDYCNDPEQSIYRGRFGNTSAYLYLGRLIEEFITFNFDEKNRKDIDRLLRKIKEIKENRDKNRDH